MRPKSLASFALQMFFCTGFSSNPCFAQSDQVLAAPVVTGNVVLGVERDARTLRMTSNRYNPGASGFAPAAPFAGDLIMLRNRGFNIAYRTVNPLRYQVSAVRNGRTTDGYKEEVQSLLTAVQTVMMAVTDGTYPLSGNTPGPLSSSSSDFTIKQGYAKVYPKLKEIEDLAKAETDPASHIIRDTRFMKAILDLRNIDANMKKTRNAPKGLLILIDSLERTYKRVESEAGFSFVAKAVPLVKDLFNVDFTNANAVEDINAILKGVSKLEKRNERLDSLLHTLKKWQASTLLQSNARVESGAIKKPLKGSLPVVTFLHAELLNLAREDAAQRIEAMLKARESVVERIRSLAEHLAKEKGDIDGNGNGTELVRSDLLPKDSIDKFTLAIRERWFDVDNNLSFVPRDSLWFQRDIRLMKTHTFYPQVFPSVVFSDLSIPTYELNNDTVVFTGESERNIKVAGMVNFNIKMGTRQEVPFLQMGASFLKNRPLILLGAGIRFTEWFGVSGGVMIGWRPELTELEVGDVVRSETDLQNDLSYQFMKPTYYIGFQFRPTSLTTLR